MSYFCHDGQYFYSAKDEKYLFHEPFLTFVTEASTNTFDPAFTVSAGTLHWDLGDGSILDSNAFEHTYAEAGNKTVKVYKGTTENINTITQIKIGNDDLVGTLNLSSLGNLGGQFLSFENPNLTSILNPVSSETFIIYAVYDCDITGTLDLSNLTGFGGEALFYLNPNLTQILNPTSSETFTNYQAYSCNLTGTLDLTGLTGLGGWIKLQTNSNLTQILNPTSSTIIYYYDAYDCSLSGTLDVSGLTGLKSIFQVYNNSNLCEIILPDTLSHPIKIFDADDCSLSQTTVDNVLSKLNVFFDASAPVDSLTVDLGGGTNMSPTDGESNADIVNLTSIFSDAEQDLTITIN